jgi:hypothetical protein
MSLYLKRLYGSLNVCNTSTPPQTLQVDPTFKHSLPSPQTDITSSQTLYKKNASVGKCGGGVYNIGLALVRLEHIANNTEWTTADGQLCVKAFIPDWWPQAHKQ